MLPIVTFKTMISTKTMVFWKAEVKDSSNPIRYKSPLGLLTRRCLKNAEEQITAHALVIWKSLFQCKIIFLKILYKVCSIFDHNLRYNQFAFQCYAERNIYFDWCSGTIKSSISNASINLFSYIYFLIFFHVTLYTVPQIIREKCTKKSNCQIYLRSTRTTIQEQRETTTLLIEHVTIINRLKEQKHLQETEVIQSQVTATPP